MSKFRTLLPTNFFQKTFLGGYHNCTLFIFINFHYRFLGLFFGIVLGLFWDCFGIVFWDRFLGLPSTVAPLKPVSDQYVEDNVVIFSSKSL